MASRLVSLARMPNRTLFLEVATTEQLVGRIVEERLEPVGIPAYLLALLVHVRDAEPVTPSAVARAAGIPVTTLRDNVQRLVDRRLVRRLPNPSDGRSYHLVTTTRGRTVAQAASDALLEAYLELEARLTRPRADVEDELRRLNDALRETLGALSTRRPGR
jgi:DNA-binding MarR family transcriptional regulator